MISDWKVLVVRLQRIRGSSEYYTAVVGMIHTSKEISVVTDLERQMSSNIF